MSYREVLTIALERLAARDRADVARGRGRAHSLAPCRPGPCSTTCHDGLTEARAPRLAARDPFEHRPRSHRRVDGGDRCALRPLHRRERDRLVQAGTPALGGVPRARREPIRSRHVHVAQSLFHDIDACRRSSGSRRSGSTGSASRTIRGRPWTLWALSTARGRARRARAGSQLMSSLRARCPSCRTFTAVAIGDALRVPQLRQRRSRPGSCASRAAWGSGGEGDGRRCARRAARIPRSRSSSADTLDEQTEAVAEALPARPIVARRLLLHARRRGRGLARRVDRLARRLDRRARRPQHARDLALREPLGHAVPDAPRRRRRVARRRRARRSAQPRSARGRSSSAAAGIDDSLDRALTGVDADVRRARPRRARSERGRRPHPRAGRAFRRRDRSAPARRRGQNARSQGWASPASSRPERNALLARADARRGRASEPGTRLQRMSSGQGRVDVEVESKRPDEPTPERRPPEHVPRAAARTTATTSSSRRSRVCPQCGHHFRVRGARADRAARRPGLVRRGGRRPALGGSARVLRPAAVHRAPRRGRGRDRARRRDRHAARPRSRASRASSRSWTSRSWAARWGASSARSSRAPASARPSAALPLVSVSASGGARMQEGILALMQLPKTVCARRRAARVAAARCSPCSRIRRRAACSRASRASATSSIAEPGALHVVRRPARRRRRRRARSSRRLRPRRVELPLRPPRRDRPAARAAADARAAPAALREADVPSEAELRLRERLSKLGGMKLLRGTQAQRRARRACSEQLDQLARGRRPTRRSGSRSSSRATRSARTRSTTSSASSTTSSSCTATAAAPTTTRSSTGHRQARRPHDRRSSATRRAATSKERTSRNFGMAYPEGYRKAMRAMELADRHGFPLAHAGRHARRLSGRRRRAARPGRRDRALAGGDGAAERADRRLRDRRGRLRRRGRDRASPTAC